MTIKTHAPQASEALTRACRTAVEQQISQSEKLSAVLYSLIVNGVATNSHNYPHGEMKVWLGSLGPVARDSALTVKLTSTIQH